MTIDEAIAATLAEWHVHPFTWAEFNCGFSVADYIRRLTGIDPARHIRPLCRSEEDARRLMHDAGGNAALIRKAMKDAGFSPAPDLRRGDAIVIRVRKKEIFAIWLDPFAATRNPNGVYRTRRFELLEAYRCA